MRIGEIDVGSDADLAAWYAAEATSIGHDRPHAVHRTYPALVNQVRHPSRFRRTQLLAAWDRDELVGSCELAFSLEDNTHLADLEVHVVPTHRRQGVGRALYEEAAGRCAAAGRTTELAELFVPAGESTSPGLEFARAVGYRTAHVEDHLVLPLPVPPETVAALADRVAGPSAGYEIVTWGDRCPDELVASYCAMKTQMSGDVPIGEIDYTPIVYTEERLRAGEQRTARSYRQLIAAARCEDGTLAGYSQVFLALGTDQVLQDDTLVMPAHRGNRLGTALKLATLQIVQREHPERRSFHTWTDPDNHAMYRTNAGFGYVAAERMHEVQRRASDG